jgi:hypothetical protein
MLARNGAKAGQEKGERSLRPETGSTVPQLTKVLSPWEEAIGVVKSVERDRLILSVEADVIVPIGEGQLLDFKSLLVEGRNVATLMMEDGRIRVRPAALPID